MSDEKIIDHLRPVPVPDDLTRPFWEAAQQRRLDIQRCQRCKTYFNPPLPFCDICDSRDLKFETVSGRGRIYTFSYVHLSQQKAFVNALPFPVVHVELEEQPWLLVRGNMADTDPSDIKVGAPVELTFIEITDGWVLPDFKLAEAETEHAVQGRG